VARFLQDICHREDPTRPVTNGMDRVDQVFSNHMAAIMDVPGFHYPFLPLSGGIREAAAAACSG